MPPVRPTLLVAILALLSCAPAQRRAAAPSPGADPPIPAIGVEAPPRALDVAGWRAWTKVNPRRFRSKGHGYLWVDVYVDRAHAAAYADRAQPAPEGFTVVMAGYEASDGKAPTGLTVMAKMPPGYDAASGDWYYAVYDPDGKTATLGGKLAPCTGCHVHAPRDFLYGVVAGDEP
jgi:hypothetical protein